MHHTVPVEELGNPVSFDITGLCILVIHRLSTKSSPLQELKHSHMAEKNPHVLIS